MSETERKHLTVSEAVNSRHSCRKFLSKEVSLDLINKILNEARRCPSSSNLQPWKIYLIYGDTKQKLTSIINNKFDNGIFGDAPFQYQIAPGVDHPADMSKFKKQFPKYKARQSAMGKAIYTAQGIKRDDMEGRMKHVRENWEFFGAPIGLFFTIDKRMSYGQYPDLGIMLNTIMLLCQQYGLATCCQVAWALWHQTLRNTFNICENELIFCGMCIGYENKQAKVNHVRTERMSFNEMVVIPKISDDIKLVPPSKMEIYIGKSKIIWILFKGSSFYNVFIFIMLALFIWIVYHNACDFC